MIAVAITGIVAGGVFTVFRSCFLYWDRYNQRARLSLYGRIATERIARDIRESLEILEVAEDHINFRAKDDEIYSYNLQDGIVYKTSHEDNVPLLEDVSGFSIFTNIEQRYFTVIINLETEHTALTYRTGVTRRISAVP